MFWCKKWSGDCGDGENGVADNAGVADWAGDGVWVAALVAIYIHSKHTRYRCIVC